MRVDRCFSSDKNEQEYPSGCGSIAAAVLWNQHCDVCAEESFADWPVERSLQF
jgi:hypothetical protein